MNARRMMVAVLVIGLLVVGVGVAAAQGGNGPGPGPGTGDCPLGEACPMNQAQTQAQMGNGFGPGPANCAADGACVQQQTQTQAQMGNGFGQDGRWSNAQMANRFAAATGPLTDTVVEAMNAGWLDEANAYSAYEALIAQFGEVIPFVQLQRAEAQHMSAWERQFERFGLALPDMPVAASLPEFTSIADACAAGAAIEEANIGLYDEMLTAFDGYPSLTRVVTALRAASLERHLPALEACAG